MTAITHYWLGRPPEPVYVLSGLYPIGQDIDAATLASAFVSCEIALPYAEEHVTVSSALLSTQLITLTVGASGLDAADVSTTLMGATSTVLIQSTAVSPEATDVSTAFLAGAATVLVVSTTDDIHSADVSTAFIGSTLT